MLTQEDTDKKLRNSVDQKIRDFFSLYEKRFNEGLDGKTDLETAEEFADCFIAADPHGVRCYRNGAGLMQSIPTEYEFYKNIGITSVKIVSQNITPVDDNHFMIRIHWVSMYKSKKMNEAEDQIEFDVIYLLQYVREQLKIFAYITGDEQAILKEKGLISEK